MKKKYLILDFIEFSLIFFAFVVSPLEFEYQNSIYIDVNYSFILILIEICIIVYLLIRMYDIGLSFRSQVNFTLHHTMQFFLKSILIYGFLALTGLFFNYLTNVINYQPPEIHVQAPDSLFLWFWFILSVSVLACFEEVIFRQYLPEKIFYYLRNSSSYVSLSNNKKCIINNFIELLVILAFAIGHSYLGIISVFASFVSGLILRISVNTFKSIVPACIAHSLNNIVSFLVLFSLT